MKRLSMVELEQVRGGGFWSGMACGLSAVGAFVLWTSPDPFSKLAALTYSGAAIGCVTAYL
jgi:hypothetical protein